MTSLMLTIIIAATQYAGTVDMIEEDIAVVEMISEDSEPITLELPVAIFPCEIKEGDWFYMEQIDGVTELRCGEPPL